MQRTLESRVFISAILAMAAGAFLFTHALFPISKSPSCHCLRALRTLL